MLSLPLGIRYAGWIIGIGGLVLSALVTKYTAAILAECLDVDSSLTNFADIGFVAFGEKGRIGTSTLFTLELVAAEVALVILFADSLNSLIPDWGSVTWKIICGLILAPLNFFPMTWLSYTSFLGIFCGLALIVVIVVDGLVTTEAPGSLRQPMKTSWFPEHWMALPLSFGLIMAPWGGHSVFPNIYRDMRHPWYYGRSLKYIFTFVTSTDISMAVIGYLMFGTEIKDEVTTNILQAGDRYSKWSEILVLVLISIIPLTKFPLNCAPIVSTMEVLFRIDPRTATLKPNRFNQSKILTWTLRVAFRILTVVVIVLLAIVVPSFEVASAIMGAAFCFSICVIVPCAFHLKMFGKELTRSRRFWDWTLIGVSTVLAIFGTVWEFLPKHWMGID